jgi:hypothetical protein
LYSVLVFAAGAFPPEAQTKPNDVTEDELREAVSRYWQIDEIRPAFIHVGDAILQIPGMRVPSPFSVENQGRQKIHAFLLTAHKAG